MPHKNKERKKERQKTYRLNNKAKIQEYRRQNKDKISQSGKIYYQKNKSRISQRDKIYYQQNKDRISQRTRRHRRQNKAKITQRNKTYHNSPNGKNIFRLARSRRRAKKRLLKHSFTVDEWNQKLKASFGICSGYAKQPHYVGIEKLTLDHIMPISKAPISFEYTINDIQPLCHSCNSSKSAAL